MLLSVTLYLIYEYIAIVIVIVIVIVYSLTDKLETSCILGRAPTGILKQCNAAAAELPQPHGPGVIHSRSHSTIRIIDTNVRVRVPY